MKEVKVPPLGESVIEATVGNWHKKEGDVVRSGELLVELETDKITLEVNADFSGVIEKIKAKQGDVVKVGDVLGDMKQVSTQSDTKAEVSESNVIKPDNLSPATRKIVKERNIDTTKVAGTGKDGRITKGDLLQEEPFSETRSLNTEGRVEERVKMSRLRQRIAERLKVSQNTAAILTTFNEVDLSKITNLRAKYQEEFVKQNNVKLGFMSFFVKAAVAALKANPIVNAEIDGDTIIYKKYYDIGVAVGTDKGLVVPILRDVDQLSFAGIEYEIAMLAKKARDGKLSMEELTGGTFSITNGGIYGSLLSTPIINPPQSAILGMHNIVQRPVAVDGKVEIRPMMYVALSYDHRIIDGKDAVTFLTKVKEYVENPEIFCLIG
jgi:2-oxoglutarate dehydrogenase E2 component (dihydrolipoamide succinyltransferase)